MIFVLQLEETVETVLAALPLIQSALLQNRHPADLPVTVSSPMAGAVLDSHNATSLSLSTFSLPQPVPLTLTFPSAASLAGFLSQHPCMQVQVTTFALNPFKHLASSPEIRSVGNAILATGQETLHIQDLSEEIEIGLGRDSSMEAPPTSLNTSAQELSVELNVTARADTLIICIRPNSPLQITLRLGFQHQPSSLE
uniref:Uncharacterized protein n=1 Tax=Sphenodon punctatus TaxID=8508 RepID=A0A8D0GHN6_SPHPU